jgi:FecR protein.
MKRHITFFVVTACVVTFLFASAALAADAQIPAGSVKNITGTASVSHAGAAAKALSPGDRLFEKDVLVTGKDSSLGVILRDNTTLSLGPSSRLVVERFLFEPQKGSLAQVLRISRGSMAAVSGEIVKLNPAVARVETPLYSIGIRGTHFLLNLEPGLESEADKAADKAAGMTPGMTGGVAK